MALFPLDKDSLAGSGPSVKRKFEIFSASGEQKLPSHEAL